MFVIVRIVSRIEYSSFGHKSRIESRLPFSDRCKVSKYCRLLSIDFNLFIFDILSRSGSPKTVCQGKSTTTKRPVRTKLAMIVTPLRQVMSKSIQRALREHVTVADNHTTSPLDLRMSPVVRRSDIENSSPFKRSAIKAIKSTEEITPELIATQRKRRSVERRRSGSMLETVYELAKATSIADECENQNETNALIEAGTKENVDPSHKSNESDGSSDLPMAETSINISVMAVNLNGTPDKLDVWFTPSQKEVLPSRIENSEVNARAHCRSTRIALIGLNSFFFLFCKIYTPISKSANWPSKRPPLRHSKKVYDDDDIDCTDSKAKLAGKDWKSEKPEVNRANKLWSLVSSVLRFASLTSTDATKCAEPIIDSNVSDDTELSPFTIKRCASFAGECLFVAVRHSSIQSNRIHAFRRCRQ